MRRVPPIANPSTDPALPYRDASSGNYPGSWPGAEFYNALLAELCHLIEHAGITLDQNDLQQVRKAVDAKIAAAVGSGSSVLRDMRVVTAGPLTSPPGAPVDGDQYLIAAGATGDFAGKDYQIATRASGAWSYSGAVIVGRVFRIDGTDSYFERTVGGWAAYTPPVRSHTHPQSDVTNLVSDLAAIVTSIAGKVAKTGDVMSGTLEIGVADNANALGIRGGGALKYTLCPIPNGANYGLQIFRYGGSAGNGAQALFDHDGSTRLYGAAQIDGNLALGAITPTAKLDVNGDTCLRGNIVSAVTNGYRLIAANPDASKTSGAYYQAFGSTHASLPGAHIFGSSGTDWLTLMGSGAVKFNGDAGTSSKVLVGNASGPPTWTAITSLIGKKIIAIGTANSGNTINFATSEPDTSYSGIVWNGVGSDSSSNASTLGVGSISSKTTTSCVVTKGNTTGAPGMTGTDPVFFIIYR